MASFAGFSFRLGLKLFLTQRHLITRPMRFPYQTIISVFILFGLVSCTPIPDAEYKTATPVPETVSPPPIMFSKLRIDIPVGTQIGTLNDSSVAGLSLFAVPADRRMLQRGIDNKELARVFNDVMEGQGYDVVRHLDLTFDEEIENELLRTEYRISGKIIDAKTNIMNEGRPIIGDSVGIGSGGYRGELYVKIEWSVFDALQRKTIYKTVTEGRGKHPDANPDGLILIMNAAFEMAVHNLGADEDFYDLFARGIQPPNWRSNKSDQRPLKYEADEVVELDIKPLSTTPFFQQTTKAQASAVLVQGGAGHGSGFFITKDGHIITNQHVIGNAQRVRIVTSGQQDELVAQVLRVDHQRDVALLKLENPPNNLSPVVQPMRLDWPKVGEDIYALGAPKSVRLQDTVSRGIVSAHRPQYKQIGTRQDFIQGDVPIHGGNSGGPLFDAYGNVVGISVLGLYMHEGKRSSDLNLFIPIEDALKKLQINY